MTMSSAVKPQTRTDCLHVILVVLVMQYPSWWLLLLDFSVQILTISLKPMLLLCQENILPLCPPECFPSELGQVLGYCFITTLSDVGLSNYIHSYNSSGKTHATSVSGTEIISLTALPWIQQQHLSLIFLSSDKLLFFLYRVPCPEVPPCICTSSGLS